MKLVGSFLDPTQHILIINKAGNVVMLKFNYQLYFRNRREESDQEFIALSALLLCGDLKLKPDTFQAITNKQEVGRRANNK